ncbi:MAG: hypothetical protein O6761_06795 [Thaumarchaeota archaeon]|nr:hypothetical protein [Nitrososphaerota archaeon]
MFGICKHNESDLVETFGDAPNIVECRKCHKRISELDTTGIIYANDYGGEDKIWRNKK